MFKQKRIPIILAAVCFVAALGIMLYPAVSNYVNEKYRSEIHTAYEEVIQQAENEELLEIRNRAAEYNQDITPGNTFTQEAVEAASEDYSEQLDPSGNGIMGYVEIPKINTYLPIYHGTEAETLEKGTGHLIGSSLPIGGESSHSVITGHSGLASQRMFTDLEQLQEGDVFYLHILDEVLAYQIFDTEPVLPHNTSRLSIMQGEDFCTLITCYPTGINTHRLFVQGTRIPYEAAQEVQEEIELTGEPQTSNWEEQYLLGILFGILAALVAALAAILVVMYRRKHLKRKCRKGGRYAKKA